MRMNMLMQSPCKDAKGAYDVTSYTDECNSQFKSVYSSHTERLFFFFIFF